jgi:hypothetical protein
MFAATVMESNAVKVEIRHSMDAPSHFAPLGPILQKKDSFPYTVDIP